MKLGISSYTFTWAIGVPGYPTADRLTAFGLLDKAAALDVGVVQIADNLPLDALREDQLAALITRAASLGIQIEVGTRGILPEHLAVARSEDPLSHRPDNPGPCLRRNCQPPGTVESEARGRRAGAAGLLGGLSGITARRVRRCLSLT